MASHDVKFCRANRRWRTAAGLSWWATPTAFRFAHMAATCYCSLACDLTCTKVSTFSVRGLNDRKNGRCCYRVTTWTQSSWIPWNHVGSIRLFSQRTSRDVNVSAKKRKTMNVHAPLESSFAFILSLWEVLTAQKHGSAISMQEMIFPPCSAFFCSTTNLLLEHKIQHTCWVPVQKHKSSYTILFLWSTCNK